MRYLITDEIWARPRPDGRALPLEAGPGAGAARSHVLRGPPLLGEDRNPLARPAGRVRGLGRRLQRRPRTSGPPNQS